MLSIKKYLRNHVGWIKHIFGNTIMVILTRHVSLVLAVIFVSLFFGGSDYLVEMTTKYTTDIATDSALVYVSLRGINAVLSFAQEFEVNVSILVTSGFNTTI